MGNIASQFATAFRDFVTDGVASSGPHEVIKAEVRAIGPLIEAALGVVSLGSADVIKDTRANLNADLAHPADAVALVYADATDANNDFYIKVGASGTGSWALTTILHDVIATAAAPALALAEEWAENPEDDEITGNPGQFSALHHAAKAAASSEAAVAAAGGALVFSQGLRDRFTDLVGRYGGTQTAASAGVNGICRAFDCGTDFDAGYIDGVRGRITASAVPLVTAKVWERAGDSASLNSAPGAVGDVLVAEASITGAQFTANGQYVPTPRYLARDGFIYLVALEAYEEDGTTRVAVQYFFRLITDEAQRFEGFTRTNAGSYVNFTSTRTLAMGIVSASIVDAASEKRKADLIRLDQQRTNFFAAQLRNENGARAECFADPIGAGVSVRFGGDSLCEQITGSPARISSAVVAALMPGATVINVGVGGQTTAQIEDTLNARSASEWAWSNFVNASTNDEAAISYTTTKAEIDSLIGRFTGEWVFTPAIRSGGEMSPKQRRIFHELRADHGARIWDWENFTASYEGISDQVTRVDGLHLSSLGCSKLGLIQTRLIRAMNDGAPYIHDEVLPLRNGDAAGTDYSDGLILGTSQNTRIVAGDNSDGALTINQATGLIERGAGQLAFGSRELIVRAENEYGAHEARKTFLICRDASDTTPGYEVELLGNERQCPVLPVNPASTASAFVPAITPPTKLTFFVSMRALTADAAGAFDNVILLGLNGGIPRFLGRYTTGGLIGTSPTLPEPVNRFNINGYFVSVDTDLGVLSWATNEDSGTVAIPADSAPISMSFDRLFMSTGSYLRGVALSRYMLFTGRAFDVTDAAERELFYDPATGLAKDIGGSATVDGTQAVIDLYGREGDWFFGHNAGTLGDLFPPAWRGMQNVGFRDFG